MSIEAEVRQQVSQAIEASEKILLALDEGNFDEINALDKPRREFIRTLSKMRKSQDMLQNYVEEIKKIDELDKDILNKTEKLRDEVLTEIMSKHNISAGCSSYIQNQHHSDSN